MFNLRNSSQLADLTEKQLTVLRYWLFEERLTASEAVKRLKQEYGIEVKRHSVMSYARAINKQRLERLSMKGRYSIERGVVRVLEPCTLTVADLAKLIIEASNTQYTPRATDHDDLTEMTIPGP